MTTSAPQLIQLGLSTGRVPYSRDEPERAGLQLQTNPQHSGLRTDHEGNAPAGCIGAHCSRFQRDLQPEAGFGAPQVSRRGEHSEKSIQTAGCAPVARAPESYHTASSDSCQLMALTELTVCALQRSFERANRFSFPRTFPIDSGKQMSDRFMQSRRPPLADRRSSNLRSVSGARP